MDELAWIRGIVLIDFLTVRWWGALISVPIFRVVVLIIRFFAVVIVGAFVICSFPCLELLPCLLVASFPIIIVS
jgi:hypothetical protein